jgi:hypothetical protein
VHRSVAQSPNFESNPRRAEQYGGSNKEKQAVCGCSNGVLKEGKGRPPQARRMHVSIWEKERRKCGRASGGISGTTGGRVREPTTLCVEPRTSHPAETVRTSRECCHPFIPRSHVIAAIIDRSEQSVSLHLALQCHELRHRPLRACIGPRSALGLHYHLCKNDGHPGHKRGVWKRAASSKEGIITHTRPCAQ